MVAVARSPAPKALAASWVASEPLRAGCPEGFLFPLPPLAPCSPAALWRPQWPSNPSLQAATKGFCSLCPPWPRVHLPPADALPPLHGTLAWHANTYVQAARKCSCRAPYPREPFGVPSPLHGTLRERQAKRHPPQVEPRSGAAGVGSVRSPAPTGNGTRSR
jgi:hypothetical protein